MLSRLSPARQGLFKDSWKAFQIRYKASRFAGSIYVPTKQPPKGGWPLVVTDLPGDSGDFQAIYNKCVLVRCPENMPYEALYKVIPELANRVVKVNARKVAFIQRPMFRLPKAFDSPGILPMLVPTKAYSFVLQVKSWNVVQGYNSLAKALSDFFETLE